MVVHWSGRPVNYKIKKIADKYKLKLFKIAVMQFNQNLKKSIVSFGDVCTYSMHPLKNLNVWGDGGFIVTNNRKLYERLSLIRNHGLLNRNTCKEFGYNSRLDTIQVTIANYKLKNKLNNITKKE